MGRTGDVGSCFVYIPLLLRIALPEGVAWDCLCAYFFAMRPVEGPGFLGSVALFMMLAFRLHVSNPSLLRITSFTKSLRTADGRYMPVPSFHRPMGLSLMLFIIGIFVSLGSWCNSLRLQPH